MPKINYQNKEIVLPEESRAQDLAKKLHFNEPDQALTVSINGTQKDLFTLLNEGDELIFYHFEDPKGKEVFWHTSAHVLAQAVLRLFPKALPTIGPPIENGFYYDFANIDISEGDFSKIEKEIKNIIKENFKPELFHFENKKEALEAFGKNRFKKELIESFDPKSSITAYKQGEFFDLCRGPHLPNLGKIKAFKLLKTSGAYWRGDAKNEMLTRIYAISFPNRELLKAYLHRVEEAKKRDHRLIGSQLNLFSFKEEAPAMPFFHPRGIALWDQLVSFWKELHIKRGYQIIKTPQMLTKELWVRSGHWNYYRENMFTSKVSKEREFAIKPMSCPGCMLYYKTHSHSYKEFPLRIAEMGHVHRHEPSGALNGLFRVQSFHQDDAHIFMKQDQIQNEILEILDLVKEIYETFGLKYTFELSTRPEKSIGTDKDWLLTTEALKKALDATGIPYKINAGEGAFYGPKIDLHIYDALERAWQCGTLQLDMALPENFDLEYKDIDGKLKRPIMLHRAIFGSLERFLAILIEHFSGKFPLWMSPIPIRLIPVAQVHHSYTKKIALTIQEHGLMCDIDDSRESMGKKIRTAQLLKINYMLTTGDREVQNQTVSLRTRDNILHGELKLNNLLKKLQFEYRKKELTSSY